MNAKTKILIKHNTCKYEWNIVPDSFLRGNRCPKCAGKLKMNHEEFCSKINIVNPNIKVLGQYISANKNIKCQCLIDNYIWNPRPSLILRGTKCPKCSGRIVTHEDFIQRMKLINNNIIILDAYQKSYIKIKCRCVLDNYEWMATPDNLLQGYGCPKCGGSLKKTHEEFVNELEKINQNIIVLGKYINIDMHIKCKCKIDNHIWSPTPYTLLKNVGCPICNESKGEKRIAKYLNINQIDFKPQYKFKDLVGVKNGLLSYDFYLPYYNLLIEYQGEFHKSRQKHVSENKFKKQQEHDKRKREYAVNNNINLLEIWYWDFDNIEEILKKELNLI